MNKEQKLKRIILMNWDNARPAFVNAALELKNRGYEIVYWVALNQAALARIKEQFKETQFHLHEDAINIIPPPEIDETKFLPPGEDLLKQLYEAESVLAGMKKFYILSKSVLEKKHLFNRLVRYWQGILEKYRPDIICFVLEPHSVFDFTLYSLAKILKIKTVMFEYGGVYDRLLAITDYKLGSTALREEYLKNQDRQFKLEDLSPDIRKFYQWHLDNRQGQTMPGLMTTLKKYRGFNRLKVRLGVLAKSLKRRTFFSQLVGYIKKEIGPNMKKEYYACQSGVDLNKKYIYVPLHHQPEGSTSPLGGVFVDQILMIQILSYSLPADWLIYVKEHPVQWANSSFAFFDFRYQGFYKEIAKIKNVRLIPIETNSHELIAKSAAVSTVSGTAATEAIFRLKPVLLFGYTWLRDYPWVFQVRNAESCARALEKIQSGNQANEQQLINYLACLDKVSLNFNLENIKKDIRQSSEGEMASLIAQAVISEAEKD